MPRDDAAADTPMGDILIDSPEETDEQYVMDTDDAHIEFFAEFGFSDDNHEHDARPPPPFSRWRRDRGHVSGHAYAPWTTRQPIHRWATF